MPAIATLLTVLGAAPLFYFAFGAVGHIPDTADRMLVALIDYSALVLAFAGGVHWGLGLWPGSVRASVRFAAGVLPLIVAWVALLLSQLVAPPWALALLMAGYLATVLTEQHAARRFLVPSRYVWLRWGFSGVAMAMMGLVLVLKGIGQTIAF